MIVGVEDKQVKVLMLREICKNLMYISTVYRTTNKKMSVWRTSLAFSPPSAVMMISLIVFGILLLVFHVSAGPLVCTEDGIREPADSCAQFYECSGGIPFLKDCPYGMYFNNGMLPPKHEGHFLKGVETILLLTFIMPRITD